MSGGDAGFKLTRDGELYDLRDAPFVEKATTNDAEKARLQAILAALNPAGKAPATGSERPAENGGNRKQRQ